MKNQQRFAEIEYCIGSAFQRCGYATEATNAVIRFGFEKAELHKIQICHRSNNLPSKRVIEKCGFKFTHQEHLEHQSSCKPNPVTLNCYELIKSIGKEK